MSPLRPQSLGGFMVAGAATVLASATGCWQSPQSKAEQYIADWDTRGASLPDKEQIRFFDNHLEATSAALCQALAHEDDSVRIGAAYVISEIGERAKLAGPGVLERLRIEPDETVRMYLVEALSSIGYDSDEAVSYLAKRFESLDSTNDPLHADYSYSEADEKITVAAALYVLSKDDAKPQYLRFVTDWLKAPPNELTGPLLEGYWQRRWVAVTSLDNMPGAVEAIPLLEGLRNEPGAQPWVEVHVPRALEALR
jgi:hypothetical protein